MPNYYDVLGVGKGASEKEIRQAYRKLAREHHPDVNREDQSSENKFKQINEAYGVLSDLEKRRMYDRYGDNWSHGEQMEAAEARGRRGSTFQWSSLGDESFSFDMDPQGAGLFDRFFSQAQQEQQRRPRSVEQPLTVTLEEAFSGATRLLELVDGRRLEVKIPPGVDNGSRVRVAAGGGQRGAIYLVITVKSHPSFQRKGRDLYTEVEVPLEDAILGGETTVPTLRGSVALTIPEDTQNGQQFRLAGRGMPAINASASKSGGNKKANTGDLYATAKVKLPSDLTPEQRDLFIKLRELRAEGGG